MAIENYKDHPDEMCHVCFEEGWGTIGDADAMEPDFGSEEEFERWWNEGRHQPDKIIDLRNLPPIEEVGF